MTANLDLALVGNGQVGFLVDAVARVVWGCLPRFDGDTIFFGGHGRDQFRFVVN